MCRRHTCPSHRRCFCGYSELALQCDPDVEPHAVGWHSPGVALSYGWARGTLCVGGTRSLSFLRVLFPQREEPEADLADLRNLHFLPVGCRLELLWETLRGKMIMSVYQNSASKQTRQQVRRVNETSSPALGGHRWLRRSSNSRQSKA